MTVFHTGLIVLIAVLVLALGAGCTSIKRTVALNQMADFFERIEPNPIAKTPDNAGLQFEEVAFKSTDGVNLSAWYMPSADSDKIVIFNHFMLGNKSGAPPTRTGETSPSTSSRSTSTSWMLATASSLTT